jgi:integrase
MAWIERREKGYRVCWREGEERRTRNAPDKRTAEQLKRRVEQDIAVTGRVTIYEVPPAPPTLAERLEAWLDSLQLQVTPRTVRSYSDACVLFLRCLSQKQDAATIPVSMMRRESLIAYQNWLVATGRSLTTVSKRAQAIRLAWEWLYEGPDRQWLEPAPRKVQIRKPPAPRPVAPTWSEVDQVVAACYLHDARAPWLYPFALIARFTGLRRSEILQLRHRDLNREACTITLPGDVTKGGYSGRKLPVAPALLRHLEGHLGGGEWLVPAPELERIAAEGDGRGHVDRNMRRAWRRAEVPEHKWQGQPCHAFRKCLRTELEYLGVRREVTDYLVGHQPAGTGARHYLDAERALWPELLAAVSRIPDLHQADAPEKSS